MKVCGIELKGNNAIIASLSGDKDDYEIIAEKVKKIGLNDTKVQEDIRSFSKAIVQFFDEMNFDKIGIKARAEKGKFAGGPMSFKMEGLIQNTNYGVEIIHGATIRAKLKGISIDSSAIMKYQEEALNIAVYLLQ